MKPDQGVDEKVITLQWLIIHYFYVVNTGNTSMNTINAIFAHLGKRNIKQRHKQLSNKYVKYIKESIACLEHYNLYLT